MGLCHPEEKKELSVLGVTATVFRGGVLGVDLDVRGLRRMEGGG